MQRLETLELSGVLMEEQGLSDLANSLCYVPELKVLSVSRSSLGPSITVLADNLNSVCGLTHLELSQTQMDEEGAKALSTEWIEKSLKIRSARYITQLAGKCSHCDCRSSSEYTSLK